MVTEVEMKRELFGCQISQKSKSEFFSATDLVKAGNKWRVSNGLGFFQLAQYFRSVKSIEFIKEVESKYGKCIISTKGRSSHTWVHPLIFIDIALAVNPKLKVEVYEWLFDHLIKFRNDSGDSYKEMSASLYTRFDCPRLFQKYISKVAVQIKEEVGVKDWETATEDQLERRNKIHDSIKLLSRVLDDTNDIVRIALEENKLKYKK